MNSKLIIYAVVALLITTPNTKANSDKPVEEGKAIFTNRCASCHHVNKTLTGPALAGVDERRSIDWIINFVHSSQTMVKSGDKEAVTLFEKFNRIPMPDHPDLTDDNIKNIIAFIKSESKAAASQNQAPFAKPAVKKPNYQPVSLTDDFWPLMAIGAAIVLLIISLLFAVRITDLKKKQINF
jgi:Cytochrome c, mono- and diheme variants